MNSARRQGTAIPLLAIYMVMFAAVATLAVDYGHVQLVKTELQRAADATARGYMDYSSTNSQAYANIHAPALYANANNPVDGPHPTATTAWGYWTPSSSTFSTSSGTLSAMQVKLTCTAANGNAVPLFWGGLLHIVSVDVHATAVACAKPGVVPFVGLGSIIMNNGAFADSYTSSSGTYSSQSHTKLAIVQSNGNINLTGGSVVNGNANPGTGHSTSVSGGSSVSGSTTPLTAALNYPTPTAPGTATNLGNIDLGNVQTQTISTGVYSCTGLAVGGSAILYITGQVTLYVNGQVNISGVANVTQNLPSNFNIQVTSNGSVSVSGSGELDADIYAPLSAVTVNNAGIFCGGIISNTLSLSGSGGVHEDLSGGSGAAIVTLAQ